MMIKNQKKNTYLIADSNKMVKTNAAAGLIFLLPAEITIDILSRLPVDSVIQCKRVCKTWRSIVDDPTFLALLTQRFITSSATSFCFLLFVAHKDQRLLSPTYYRLHFGEYHDDEDEDNDNANKKKITISNHVKQSSNNNYKPIPHYPFDHHQFDNLKRISSCNGLLLIASISHSHDNLDDAMMVFNPLTREYVYLPPLAGFLPPLEHSMTSITGFGYHPSTNEYKVVTITYPPAEEEEGSHGYLYVYTLGSGRWRRGSIDSSYSMFHHMGVLLNGVLHWIGVTTSDGVLSFDLANEELKILPSPPLEDWMESWYCCINQQLGVLEGCLCVSRIVTGNISIRTYIWVLMKYPAAANSCNMSWTMKFSITPRIFGVVLPEKSYAFVGALKSGKILFSTFHDRRLHLIAYDPETYCIHEHDQSESFHAHLNGHSSLIKLIPHVKSFVSLKALGEETAKYI